MSSIITDQKDRSSHHISTGHFSLPQSTLDVLSFCVILTCTSLLPLLGKCVCAICVGDGTSVTILPLCGVANNDTPVCDIVRFVVSCDIVA